MYVVITYRELLGILYDWLARVHYSDRRGGLRWRALMWRTREEWSKETH